MCGFDYNISIISQELFDMVQNEMENRNNIRGASDTGKGRYSTKYLLSGLVICGDCGTKFRRYGRRLASKEYVATLVCMNHQKDSIKYSMLSVKEDNNRNTS